jgi:hypothetical protein
LWPGGHIGRQSGLGSICFLAPGFGSGQVAISETSRLWGAGFALRKEICASCAGRVSALVGYRYLHASDDLAIVTNGQGIIPIVGSSRAPGPIISAPPTISTASISG